MTAFFVPGNEAAANETENVYARIRQGAQAQTGHPPRALRIFKLAFRHGGVDLEAEVGQPDPLDGRTVLAILDLGRESPYLIHCSSGAGAAMPFLVRKPVYSVTEFSA